MAVKTANCSFVVAPDEIYGIAWSPKTISIKGVLQTTNSSAAIKDFTGLSNTQLIIEQHGLVPFTQTHEGCSSLLNNDANQYAASYCQQYIFRNGKTGYLGAAGEIYTIWQNITLIDQALEKIGGTVMKHTGSTEKAVAVRTSTQYNTYNAWVIYFNNGYMQSADGKTLNRENFSARALCPLF